MSGLFWTSAPVLMCHLSLKTVDLLLQFLPAFVWVDVPAKHENKWQINTESNARQKQHFTCLVVSSLPTWGAWSYHGVTAVRGCPSYWLVLCRSVTTRSPHDVLGPGERATTQTKTQTSCWSLFCTYVHRGQAAGHEWLKFISGCIHYAVKGLQLGLGNCGASMWLWQDSLTAQKWLSLQGQAFTLTLASSCRVPPLSICAD